MVDQYGNTIPSELNPRIYIRGYGWYYDGDNLELPVGTKIKYRLYIGTHIKSKWFRYTVTEYNNTLYLCYQNLTISITDQYGYSNNITEIYIKGYTSERYGHGGYIYLPATAKIKYRVYAGGIKSRWYRVRITDGMDTLDVHIRNVTVVIRDQYGNYVDDSSVYVEVRKYPVDNLHNGSSMYLPSGVIIRYRVWCYGLHSIWRWEYIGRNTAVVICRVQSVYVRLLDRHGNPLNDPGYYIVIKGYSIPKIYHGDTIYLPTYSIIKYRRYIDDEPYGRWYIRFITPWTSTLTVRYWKVR